MAAVRNLVIAGPMGAPMPFPALLTTDDLPRTHAPTAAALTPETLCAEAPRLRRLLHRLLAWRGSGADLDDVLQDVLLKAWRARTTFRGDAQLATWLTRIAITTAQTHARRAALRQRLFGWLLPDVAVPTADANEPLDATLTAMRCLPHADREVLVLRYLEQRDVAEIATVLGCSRAAVDARLSRARSRLRLDLGLREDS